MGVLDFALILSQQEGLVYSLFLTVFMSRKIWIRGKVIDFFLT